MVPISGRWNHFCQPLNNCTPWKIVKDLSSQITFWRATQTPVKRRIFCPCICFICLLHLVFQDACVAVTVLLHYFFLAVFMWMLMEGLYLFIKMKPTIKWSMKSAICMPVAWGKAYYIFWASSVSPKWGF